MPPDAPDRVGDANPHNEAPEAAMSTTTEQHVDDNEAIEADEFGDEELLVEEISIDGMCGVY